MATKETKTIRISADVYWALKVHVALAKTSMTQFTEKAILDKLPKKAKTK